MLVDYDRDLTMRDARARYFEVNHFGADGGYGDAWVDFKLGSLPFPFPNTKARVEAVKFHDLHHVLTGYDTDIVGEFEISAWELGAGCKGMAAAWVLNLGGLAGGLFRAPRRVFRAFVRGRRSDTLYTEAFPPLLDAKVGELRTRFMAEPAVADDASFIDAALFALTAVAGIVVGLLTMTVLVPLVPFGLLAGYLRKRNAVTA